MMLVVVVIIETTGADTDSAAVFGAVATNAIKMMIIGWYYFMR